jgi:hypothetical protein
MTQSLIDPCVFFKKEDDKMTLVTVCHVDDNLSVEILSGLPGSRKESRSISVSPILGASSANTWAYGTSGKTMRRENVMSWLQCQNSLRRSYRPHSKT